MAASATASGYGEFELNLEDAILQQLPPLFDQLSATPLAIVNIQAIPPDAQGAYLLYYQSNLVYVGKSDAEAGLRKRLERHSFKVLHRINLNPQDVTFKAARIYS